MWLYQQRGGYKLSDDPGLQFRLDEPQILEALTQKTIYELSVAEKIKIMICLMQQILCFASVRDEVDERFNEVIDMKAELRLQQITENKRIRQMEEDERKKRKEERMKEQEEQLKLKENKEEKKEGDEKKDGENSETANDAKEVKKETKKVEKPEIPVIMTDRQREAIQSQKGT